MREIKFRFWDRHSKQWIYDNVDDVEFYTLNKRDFILAPDGYYTPQQYTGLKDKNGKEIYEGDIISQTECINFETPKIYHRLINYQTGLDKVTNTFISGWNASHSQYINQDCEVIGNIFENPELLNSPKNSNTVNNSRIKSCENCNKQVNVDLNGGGHDNCDFVYGRRGWRQLGTYDS